MTPTTDPDQLPMFTLVTPTPPGWWADAGRYMVGEVEGMPEMPAAFLVPQDWYVHASPPRPAAWESRAPAAMADAASACGLKHAEGCGCRRGAVGDSGPREWAVGDAEAMPEALPPVLTPQEANGGALAPETAPGSARGPSLATGPATAAEWVDRVEACGCRKRVQMAGPRGTWALGYTVGRCGGHSGGRK